MHLPSYGTGIGGRSEDLSIESGCCNMASADVDADAEGANEYTATDEVVGRADMM